MHTTLVHLSFATVTPAAQRAGRPDPGPTLARARRSYGQTFLNLPCLQSLKLLPRELDAPTLARFLRACPGLAKPGIGEILGERDAFYEDVRAAYMQTFDFTGAAVYALLNVSGCLL